MSAPIDGAIQPVGFDQIVARLDRLEERHEHLLDQRASAVREVDAIDEGLAIVAAEHRQCLTKLRSLSR